jgi:hypothetical protein
MHKPIRVASRQRKRWILRGGECEQDDVFIWNMFSLNGITLFEVKPNTKNYADLT